MEPASPFDPSRWPHAIIDAYRNAGWPAYLTTLVTMLTAVAMSLLWARAREAKKLPLLSLLVLVPLLLGAFGYFIAMEHVEEAVRTVSPEMRDTLFAVGRGEAMCNLYIGGVLSLILGGVFAVQITTQGGSSD